MSCRVVSLIVVGLIALPAHADEGELELGISPVVGVLVRDGNVNRGLGGGLRSLGNVTVLNSTMSGNAAIAWHGGAAFLTDGVVQGADLHAVGLRSGQVHSVPILTSVEALPDGEVGELALRPGWPSMMRAYLHEEARYA